MPKPKRDIDHAVQAAHEAAMERIKAATGARTQMQLAELLDVRQSSISDAKRRCSIPPEWMIKLLRSHKLLPDWVEFGTGPQYLGDSNHAAITALQERLSGVMEDFGRLVSRVEDNLDIVTMTTAELMQRKAAAAENLAVDLVESKQMIGGLKTMAADVAALNH